MPIFSAGIKHNFNSTVLQASTTGLQKLHIKPLTSSSLQRLRAGAQKRVLIMMILDRSNPGKHAAFIFQHSNLWWKRLRPFLYAVPCGVCSTVMTCCTMNDTVIIHLG